MCPECSGLAPGWRWIRCWWFRPRAVGQRGAVKPWAPSRGGHLGQRHRACGGRERGIDLNKPWRALSEEQRRLVLYGTGEERIYVKYHGSMGTGGFRMRYEGAINSMMRRMRETKSEDMRSTKKYLSSRPCSACDGQAGAPEALGVKIAGRRSRR